MSQVGKVVGNDKPVAHPTKQPGVQSGVLYKVPLCTPGPTILGDIKSKDKNQKRKRQKRKEQEVYSKKGYEVHTAHRTTRKPTRLPLEFGVYLERHAARHQTA